MHKWLIAVMKWPTLTVWIQEKKQELNALLGVQELNQLVVMLKSFGAAIKLHICTCTLIVSHICNVRDFIKTFCLNVWYPRFLWCSGGGRLSLCCNQNAAIRRQNTTGT